MSEILKIYHALNLINVLTSITRLFETKQLNVNQLNTTAVTSNAFAFNAEFNILNKVMRNLILKN